jgi:hypothetical protein
MVRKAELEQTKHGLVPDGEGWFVLRAREIRLTPAQPRPLAPLTLREGPGAGALPQS